MATKLQFYSALADQTLGELTAKRGNWTRFLDSASYLYKYPFHDQMMIYAQRPDATACAELELWNEQFNRWVRRGSKGIALIDDSGSYPRLKYVFDVSDTEPSQYRARPVQLWEMHQEHKMPVLTELAKNYEDISVSDTLADAFRSIAKQLASEYYEDNYREILLRSENSLLEPSTAYDFSGTPIEDSDDTALSSRFEEMLTNSVAYTIMARCGIDPGEYFDTEDFDSIIDFNTPDMANALGVASSDLSEQVLRDIEIVIRKHERVKSAERSENQHERNSNLHAGRGLSPAGHQAERAAEGADGAARQVRQNEESVPQGTQADNIQPPASVGEPVPAFAGSGRSGDGAAQSDDERIDSPEYAARQGERPDGLDGGDERPESAGGGNSPNRIDLQLNEQAKGAVDETAPFSMAELAQYHSDWNEYIITGILGDEAVLNAAMNSDRQNAVTEIESSLKRLHLALSQSILDSVNTSNKGALVNELDSYFTKDRKPPLAHQLFDTVIRSDAYKEHRAKNHLPKIEQPTLSQLGNSLTSILSASPITTDEVDAILRDGGNYDSHSLHDIPYNSRSTLRIAAHFGKSMDDNVNFLKREFLTGRYGRDYSESGKGFDFGNHRVCAWFTVEGIELAIGVTAKNNIHKITIPWELTAARIETLMLEGQYVSRDAFTNSLDNERRELAENLWNFYRDDMHHIPDEWHSEHGGYPDDVALIKSLLDDDNERQAIRDRLEADVNAWSNDTENRRTWHNPPRLLDEMNAAMLPPVIVPSTSINQGKDFSYFITQDEIDSLLIRGGTYSEGKFRFMTFFLGDHNEKEKIDFVKSEYGHGGGTWSATNGWHDAEPGKGVTLQRGSIGKPDAEVNLKWNAVIKRIEQLINNGQYMTRAELERIPNYEKLILIRTVNNFYYELPPEYERPFAGKTGFNHNEFRSEDGEKTLDFYYPHEAEWKAIHSFLGDTERVDRILAQMRYIFENTSTEDRYYFSRKAGFEALSAYSEGKYTLFPGIENLPDPETAALRRIEPPAAPRHEMIEDLRESPASWDFRTTQRGEQLTLFDVGMPILPSVGEQRERIGLKLSQDIEPSVGAEVQAPAFSISDDADAPFLDISDEDKARLEEQFTQNPRSREAVNLVREIYGDTLGVPLPQAIKRIAELVENGAFSDPYAIFEKVREELSERGFAVSGELIEDGINEYNSRNGIGSFQDVANFIETEFLTEEPPDREIPQYNIGDKLTYNGKPHEIERISGDYVRLKKLGTPSAYPIFDFVSVPKADFEQRLTDGDITIEPPVVDVAPIPEPVLVEIDFDTVAQTVLERVMADTDYAETLANAKNRASLRNPCTWALEQSIRDHETDEPEVYRRYFSDDDFNDKLFDFVLKQSWERHIQPAAVIETPNDTSAPSASEQGTPSYKMGDTFYMDDGKPYILNWIGFHEISYSEPNRTYISKLMEKADFEVLLQNNPLNRHLLLQDGLGEFTAITDPAELAEIEAIFGDSRPMENQPVAEKLYEELSPSGTDTTAYYLFHNPSGTDVGVDLSHDTLALIKENADKYIICAEACFLSDSELAQWNISFRKMPRDWNLLPDAVQSQIRAVRPEYEKQWQEMYGRPEQKPTRSVPASNFRITDDQLGEGGAKTKFRYNLDAINLLHDLEFDKRSATPEEQQILSRYVGWGGLPQAFDPDNKQWENEYLELNTALSPEEYESARASTLNAHYTSPVIIKAIYETVERMGFTSGNILEPSCGIGNFFGLLPDSMRDSKLYGVELDSVTARIAKQLYPKANIKETGFEKTNTPDAFFDLAIGNVPFGEYGVLDKRYDKHKFSIHDYFFAKALDQVRPGGVVAFVTSKYTLDKKNPDVRKYIAQRAELLGAVRLPNDAFLKNAGTETTMDVIFLQKRDRPLDIEPEWVHLGLTEDGIPVNRYFLDNPEMLLGKMALDERMNNKFGRHDMTACLPIEGADLAELLKTALSHIQGEYTVEELDDLDGVDDHAIPADPNVKNFSYALVTPSDEPDDADGQIHAEIVGEGQVYFRENSLMYPVDLPAMTLDRIRGMIGLRECVNKLIALQLDDYSDDEIKAQQAELNTLYDGFIAEFGLISSTANNRAFSADSSYYLLSSLEIINEDGELERKADMFTKRTIKQRTVISHVDTASEALAVSLGEKARVDLDYMSELTGFDREKLLDDLRGVVFLNIGFAASQDKAYVTADEYLSGNVREKLRQAEAAAKVTPSLNINVEALKAIQPKDLEAGEIAVRLGATWIDPKYVQQFMYELLDTSWRNQSIYQVKYHQFTGEWQVTGKNKSQFSDINATVTYGTSRMSAYQILDDTLNLRDVRVYDYVEDADGKEKRVLNKKETTLAQQKQELIKQKFRDWLWQDPTRRQTLVRQYNDLFNSVRAREYDGSHITFGGMNPEIRMGKHQVDGAARHIYGGNALFAHVVGAGKTFTMIAAAMECKRLGLCQKSLLAVPNHLTEQWAAEFLRLYPSANILVATKKDFEMRNRKKFCAKIATGDYDAVIIGHSQLEKIPMSSERQERMLNEQIWEIEQGISELKASNGERFSIKQLEKTKKSLQVRLKKLLDSKKRDDVVTFEQLGVDRLFVDEAHSFKNLFLYTKMRNVAGLSTSEAQKSSDLYMKCRYMDELTGNKGIVFATGTPISNSMTEMYTMQRYLQYDTLIAKNLTHFDCWASIFGETQTSIELAPEGNGYRARTRFAKFHNLPELMSIFREVADIQTADMLNLPVPLAKYENIIVEPSEIQQDMVQELSERAAAVHARLVEPHVDNMLKITTDGRKIGLDQRLMNPLLPDHEGSKVNACTDKVFKVWDDSRADRLTQLVFCDFSTPNKDGRFNIYDDIRTKLIERGIPESEIAFIHDADTEVRKKELFAKVRQGKVRVLFGSTFKMGAGTNVQDRLIAIHDADCPWRPADLEQRAGRIIRQGNKNAEVQIFRYATSGTFDSYLWQTVQKKQEFIAQIMSSKSPVRSCEDVDETALSYAEIKALCAGNPLIAEKMNLDNEVAKLRMLKSEHQSQHYRLEDDLIKRFPEQITSVTERIAGIEKDIANYTVQKEKCVDVQTDLSGGASVSAKFPGMTINGVEYTEKEPAAKALLDACKGVKEKNSDVPVGEYMGFKLSLRYESFGQQINLMMRGAMTYQTDLGTDALGNLSRINHALDKLPERLEGARSQLENLNKQTEAAKLELAKPFALNDELQEKEARLALLNADLNIDGDGGFDVLNDTESRETASERSEDEPDDTYDEDELDDEDSEDYSYTGERVAQAAYAKSKPSILDGIRNFSGEKHSGVPGGVKSTERDI